MNEQLNNLFKVKHVDWIKNATIYEVYIRQYSKSGTFSGFMEHIPRLKELGVDILWIMPVQPIGCEKRKGTMGSPYAISDYLSINPDFGTLDDFKSLVNQAHASGMYVILDWVANHTAWDHTWIRSHPEFYVQDANGKVCHPANTDWFDVADLNFASLKLRHSMTEALKFWILETDIDGYRCDMANLVPTDFWEETRIELDKIKPVFMLAEAELADMHFKAFDATYNWAVHHLMNDIAAGRKPVWDLAECMKYDEQIYSPNAIRMYFTSNHDENKNAGSSVERLGNSFWAFTLLTYTLPGMPLIFSGQEAGLNRKLDFFEKDLINWNKGGEYARFYKELNALRKSNKALWCGNEGGKMVRINSNNNQKIYAFTRKKEENEILIVLNLSSDYESFKLDGTADFRNAKSFFSTNVYTDEELSLPAWGFELFIK